MGRTKCKFLRRPQGWCRGVEGGEESLGWSEIEVFQVEGDVEYRCAHDVIIYAGQVRTCLSDC